MQPIRLLGEMPLLLRTNQLTAEIIFNLGAPTGAAQYRTSKMLPELVATVPVYWTPGHRLPSLYAPDVDAPAVVAALLRGTREVAQVEHASSIHFLFCTETEKEVLAAAGYFPRLSMQFHWHNRPGRPFDSFEDYLTTLRSQNRQQVRK